MAGRPREFDRDAALAKARDAFWSRGYEGVSMSDLVSELGLAPARIYAAFGSKAELFREAVALYDADEGSFAARIVAEEPTARRAIESILREAIANCTRKGRPQGCMVVSAATNCASENDEVRNWLAAYRKRRTTLLVERLKAAATDGELPAETDVQALGDHFAGILHGIAVQARDGVPRSRLLAAVPLAMAAFDAIAGVQQRSKT